MRTLQSAVVLCILLLPSCGQEDKESSVPSDDGVIVLARVGEALITQDDFEKELARRIARKQPVSGDPQELLDEMIAHTALVQRARMAGLHQDPEVERLYENLLIGRLRKQELDEAILHAEIPEKEIKAAYEADSGKYARPAKARLSILHREVPTGADEETIASLRASLEEARRLRRETPADPGRGPASRGFGALAINHSDDQTSRYKGGDIGWVEEGRTGYRWPDEVVQAGLALPLHQPSDVLTVEGSLYVVMKTEEQARRITPYESARTSIRHRLLAEKRANLERSFQEQSRSAVSIEVFPEKLNSVEMPGPMPPTRGDADPAPPTLPE